jgi:uncharacterized protein YecE (DUF72 family)
MSVTVRVGTSGYDYPEWRGLFYPRGLRATRRLSFYAERFDTVEINATFRRMPTEKAVTGWAAATPAGFVFTVKAPGRITHSRRLRDVDELVHDFCEIARGLGDKLGPLFFQLPPNFKKELGRLRDVLAQIPPDLRCAFEFRHPSWFTDDVYEALRARNAALCIADTDEGRTPDETTATWGYYRLRNVEYTRTALARWAQSLTRPGRSEVFCYFKHEETASGPALARRLRRRLATED